MIYGWPAAVTMLAGVLLVCGILVVYVVPLLLMVQWWDDRPRAARALLGLVVVLMLVGIGASAAVYGVSS